MLFSSITGIDTASNTVVLVNSDLVDTVRVEHFPFFTPTSAISAILAATRDCFRGRASLQIEVLALRHQRSRTLGEATEADRFGSVLLGMFGSHLAELARYTNSNAQSDVGDVGNPELVDGCRRHIACQVGIYRQVVPRVGRHHERAPHTQQVVFPHHPQNPYVVDFEVPLPQLVGDSPVAAGRLFQRLSAFRHAVRFPPEWLGLVMPLATSMAANKEVTPCHNHGIGAPARQVRVAESAAYDSPPELGFLRKGRSRDPAEVQPYNVPYFLDELRVFKTCSSPPVWVMVVLASDYTGSLV
jgi:hypothetical protein